MKLSGMQNTIVSVLNIIAELYRKTIQIISCIPRRNWFMAHRIQIISIFRPRVDQGNTVQKPELLRAIGRATGIVDALLSYVIAELRDNVIEFLRSGRAVKIDGLGTWTPNIGLDGSISLQYRADTALVNALKVPGTFSGKILNRENIGQSGDELVARWNAEHPEDPVEFSEN
jgi:hypothetical protein